VDGHGLTFQRGFRPIRGLAALGVASVSDEVQSLGGPADPTPPPWVGLAASNYSSKKAAFHCQRCGIEIRERRCSLFISPRPLFPCSFKGLATNDPSEEPPVCQQMDVASKGGGAEESICSHCHVGTLAMRGGRGDGREIGFDEATNHI